MNKLILLILFGFQLQFISQNKSFKSYGSSVTDIDGNTYSTVKIGDQIWMAEDLYVTKFNDGTPIRKLKVNSFDDPYEGTFDRFEGLHKLKTPLLITPKNSHITIYNWYVVHNTKNVCPIGWHVPLPEEWDSLISFVDGTILNDIDDIGTKLKSEVGYNGIGGGTNELGFNAIPSDSSGIAWWALSNNGVNVMTPGLTVENDSLDEVLVEANDFNTLSIRCIKDE